MQLLLTPDVVVLLLNVCVVRMLLLSISMVGQLLCIHTAGILLFLITVQLVVDVAVLLLGIVL